MTGTPAIPGAINVSSLTGNEVVALHPYGQGHAQTTTQAIANLAPGGGNVTGPGSATDGHLAVFDGTTGKLIKDGGAAPTAAIAINAQTGTSYTFQASDNGKMVTFASASATTVTYPAGLGAGFNVLWQQIGAGQLTFATSGGATLNNVDTQSASKAQWAQGSIVAYAANTAILAGATA